MKISKIIIENFRCYKDRQEISFNTDGLITLFYGLTGSGKSTLLQFINWIFYDVTPNNKSGKYKNKPLYNEVKFFDELNNGDPFDVFGQVDFENNGTKFSLTKKISYKKEFNAAHFVKTSYKLSYMADNGSWVDYLDDIPAKINEFIPKALSKYFFFSGEPNALSIQNEEMKSAVFNLFGLTKYANALDHIGLTKTGSKYTALYMLNSDKTKNQPEHAKENSGKYLKQIAQTDLYLQGATKDFKTYDRRLRNTEFLISDLQKEIAVSTIDPDSEKKKLEENTETIKSLEAAINTLKLSIGNILWKNTPYLVLTEKTKFTRKVLEDSAREEKTFEGLTRATLEDILKKGECVCGNKIHEQEIKYIQKVIKSMPPDSYNYTFNQFVKKNDSKFELAKENFDQIQENLKQIIKDESIKNKLIDKNKEIAKLLKESDNAEERAKGQRLIELNAEKEEYENKKMLAFNNKTKYEKNMAELQKRYQESFSYEMKKSTAEQKIKLLEEARDEIQTKFNSGVQEIKKILNKSIIDIYNIISTRVEDFSHKSLIDDDFNLRSEYKTGGQEVIDVYSYIIGMIKAIHSFDDADKDSDFPVIIDAPFSLADYKQLAHVIDVIPTIVPQVAMFTFDIERIKSHADTSKIGSYWIIESNDQQTVSNIREGGKL